MFVPNNDAVDEYITNIYKLTDCELAKYWRFHWL